MFYALNALDQMIPQIKQLAVANALQTAFGVSAFDAIQPLTRGLSGSLVFKITVQENPYLLRVVHQVETRDKPAHYFSSMKAAAEAGIAPAVHYMNSDDQVAITDFIIERPFPISQARDKMADMIRQVHALPKFAHQVDYVGVADGFRQRFQNSNPLSERLPKDLFSIYNRITKIYPRLDHQNIVSSHNDMKPDNILYDGVRPWLVDWEAAFANDRYVDLAAMANFVVRNETEEVEFLNRYFGYEATEYHQARFFLMSQIVHMFCFTLCLSLAPTDLPPNWVETLDFRTFHDRLWKGEINLANAEAKQQYGWVHLQQLLNKLRSKRFEHSLTTVSRAG